jgi:hypothetical protein
VNPFALTKAIGVKQTLGQETIARAVTGDVRTTVSGVGPTNQTVFMGPGQPLQPMAQDTAYGRQFDYPWGTNLGFTPRQYEPISFSQLRALADSYDLVRLLIETRKDQMVKFEWAITPRDPEAKPDQRCKDFAQFLEFPDRRNNWQTWLRVLLEELLVTDAACLQPVMTVGGDLYALDWFDGTTLHLVIDETGRVPLPPDVAYQQIIKGVPAVDYSSDELLYMPRNRRVNRLYGFSPVEQIVMTVNIALRRQLNQLQYFTEGNIPEALISVPKEWNPAQIKAYQEMWDTDYVGNTAARRKLRFIPDGTKYYPTKDEILKDVFDEWLARVCCYAFSLPAAPFIRDQNRATAESAKEAALEEGLHPLMMWIRDNMNTVLWKYKGWYDLHFVWSEQEPTTPMDLMTINTGYVKSGVMSIDEARKDIGKEPVGMPNAIITGSGAVLIRDVLNPPEPAPVPGMPGAMPGEPGAPFPGEEGKKKEEQPGKRSEQTEGKVPDGDAPATKMFDLHVHLPKQDVLVDNPVTINNVTRQLTKRTVRAKRGENGELTAVVEEDPLKGNE